MKRHVDLRRGSYRDSVRLMQISQALQAVPGVSAALVAMATELNLELAAGMGFAPPEAAGPADGRLGGTPLGCRPRAGLHTRPVRLPRRHRRPRSGRLGHALLRQRAGRARGTAQRRGRRAGPAHDGAGLRYGGDRRRRPGLRQRRAARPGRPGGRLGHRCPAGDEPAGRRGCRRVALSGRRRAGPVVHSRRSGYARRARRAGRRRGHRAGRRGLQAIRRRGGLAGAVARRAAVHAGGVRAAGRVRAGPHGRSRGGAAGARAAGRHAVAAMVARGVAACTGRNRARALRRRHALRRGAADRRRRGCRTHHGGLRRRPPHSRPAAPDDRRFAAHRGAGPRASRRCVAGRGPGTRGRPGSGRRAGARARRSRRARRPRCRLADRYGGRPAGDAAPGGRAVRGGSGGVRLQRRGRPVRGRLGEERRMSLGEERRMSLGEERRMSLDEPSVVTAGVSRLAEALAAQAARYEAVAWQPPAGDAEALAIVLGDPRRPAANAEAVRRMLAAGATLVDVRPAAGGVGPMAGLVSPSMWVYVLRDEAHDRTSWCTLNEGLGAVLRYGAYGPEVIDRLRWMSGVLGPALQAAVRAHGPLDIKAMVGQMLQMGDEGHNRNRAGTLLLLRELVPHLVDSGLSSVDVAAVTRFIAGNDHFFLNLVMPSAKLQTAAAAGLPGSTVVTAMARNGTDFGIQVSGTGDAWFTGPAAVPSGLFLGGYGPDDANPDIGDSAITETAGLGGFAMAGAPAIVRFVGG